MTPDADPFYQRFFPQPGKDAIEGFQQIVRAALPDEGKVLDLGCGNHGALAPYRRADREVWGVDFQHHPHLQHPQWFRKLGPDGSIPFPDETFDLVASLWVLEHVETPVPFLTEVSRVLRPGGRFVALTPHGRHYMTWIIRLIDVFPHVLTQEIVRLLYRRPQHDTFPTRYRLNTKSQLRRSTAAAGLELSDVVEFANQEYFSFFEPLRRGAIVVDWLLDHLQPGLGRLYFVATLRKPLADSDHRQRVA